MDLNEVEMRRKIKEVYNNAPRWVDKVNRMSSGQVLAVFQKMKDTGQIKFRKR